MAIRQSRVIALVNAATGYRELIQTIKQQLENCGQLTANQAQELLTDVYAYIASESSRLDNDHLVAVAIEQHHFATKYDHNDRARVKEAEKRRAAQITARRQTHYLGETYKIQSNISIPEARSVRNSPGLSQQTKREIEEYIFRETKAREMYEDAIAAGGHGNGPVMIIATGYIAVPGDALYDATWAESAKLFDADIIKDDDPKIVSSLHLEIDEPDDES